MILYGVKVLLLIFSLLGKDNYFGKELGYMAIEAVSGSIFIVVAAISAIMMFIYLRSRIGYYFDYKLKEKYVYIIVGAGLIIELLTPFVFVGDIADTVFSSSVKSTVIYCILFQLGSVLLILVNGLTYIVCKRDYNKKLKNK